ncbi:MAG TPA: tetratricopeptide repeat protein [Thermoanaerobaculia bacterium]|nr:tetratricopeptide repeat protein [Thermoanaerobaculia bacterium]
MRRFLAPIVMLAFAAGCGTADSEPQPVITPPPPMAVSTATQERQLEEIHASLIELGDRMEVMNARLQRVESSAVQSAAIAAEVRTVPSPASVAPSPPPPPASPVAPAARSVALQGAALAETYRTALMLFGKSSMNEARRTFQEVFDSDPTGDLADNALYWIGETFYSQGNYGEAMKYYRRVSTDYAGENKAADALLKMGLVHVRTGDLMLARSTFQQLIDRYPYSTPAAAARNELKRIRY